MATVAFAALAAGCSKGGTTGPAPSPGPSVQNVRAIDVERGSIEPGLALPGTIAPFATVALSNSINEPAADVFVQEGDVVHRGQVLADLDVDDLQASLAAAQRTGVADQDRTSQSQYSAQLTVAQAPNQTRQAEAQVLQARQTYAEALRNQARDAQLVAQGYLARQNLDEQRVVVTTDRQAIASAEAALQSAAANQRANGSTSSGLQGSTIAAARDDAAAQFATAEQIRREIARARITSPIDGVVVNRNLNPGEYPSGRQIFTLEDNATVFAVLTASATEAYQIRAGERARRERCRPAPRPLRRSRRRAPRCGDAGLDEFHGQGRDRESDRRTARRKRRFKPWSRCDRSPESSSRPRRFSNDERDARHRDPRRSRTRSHGSRDCDRRRRFHRLRSRGRRTDRPRRRRGYRRRRSGSRRSANAPCG